MIRNVIFDFGNVIATFDPIKICGKYAENEADVRLMADTIFDARWADLDAGRVEYEEYIKQSLERLPARLHGAARALFEGWCGELEPIEATARLARALRAKGYGLYILSNAPVCFSEKVEKYAFARQVDGAVYSAEIKMEKPDAAIYRHLLEKYGLRAEECFFLDDKPCNIEGARACGMHGMVYTGDAEQALREIAHIDRGLCAKENFLGGCNCAQSVLLSFGDVTGFDRETAMRLASSFGGGMGRMREVCGTVSGMLMVLGLVMGYDADAPTAAADKQAHYRRVQELSGRFRERFGSIVCRDILSGHVAKEVKRLHDAENEQLRAMLSDAPDPTPRTEEYYRKRPCAELAFYAAYLLDGYLDEVG